MGLHPHDFRKGRNEEMNAIEMRDVSKAYRDFALSHVSLTLPSGGIMGLIGENGAGKSTTINLIMNAVERDSGRITVLGSDNRDKGFSKIREDIGVVLDEAYFPEVLNARQVNSIMKYTFKRWDEVIYFDYIRKFDLPKNKMFKEYSRGMKMKLAIAVALSHSPKLLILDEATSGLDPIVRDEILEIFNDFTRDETHSVLLSSHITSDLEKICDYIAFIHKGSLIFSEEKDRLLEGYGIVHLSRDDFSALPSEIILGYKDLGYSVDALVKRKEIPSRFPVDRARIEEIMLFLVKGGSRA